MSDARKAWLLLLCFHISPIFIFSQSQNENNSLLEKGNVYVGLTFSFSVDNTENQDLLVVQIQDRKRTVFEFNLNSGYFIKDNWALGGQLSYGSSKRLGNEINIQGIQQQVSMVQESWGIYGTMKNFLPLGSKKRFYLYTLVLLGGRIENELAEITAENVLTRTYTKDRLLELRVVPGLVANVVKGFTVEVGADIAGIQTSWSRTEVNGIPTTKQSGVSADLSISLLRLSLGFYYYFGIRHK